MKKKLKLVMLLPFFAFIIFYSCQEEKIEITEPVESESLAPDAMLTTLISSTSKKDGSKDNIIDQASCLSVELPVTVIIKDIDIIINSEEDFKLIESIYDEFEDDEDTLDIIFPITIILSNHEEVVISNSQALDDLVAGCHDENEEDDDIECIDFQYPISFAIYNPDFQVINTITIENDRALYRFIKRVRNEEVFASLNFPVTMKLADGSLVEVNNNNALENVINEAKDNCDEDDDNNYHDDDFTKESLDTYLKLCPWVVYEFKRNEEDLGDTYKQYTIKFIDNNVLKMRSKEGELLTGSWSTRVTDNGALIKLEFDNLADFTLEWFVYDLGKESIKFFQVGGNKILLKKNCDVVVDYTKEYIENVLQECLWRVARLTVNGTENDKQYIGEPLKFLENSVVKLKVNGDLVDGTYQIESINNSFILQVTIDERPNLKLEWAITFLDDDLIKLANADNKLTLERHCVGEDQDLNDIETILTSSWGAGWDGDWIVTSYIDGDTQQKDEFQSYTLTFSETGSVNVYHNEVPNNVSYTGSWLAYRSADLFLGLNFKNNSPFNNLNHRWKINAVSQDRIELRDYNDNGTIERILVLEINNW
ncbi:hypothetical protein GCM10022291_19740 [Postechiella marina]|uniref:Lipoprotein n=1 Tax=Postechiella marina TaxID=943941 RepID=A0ABP8C9J9_9FLAO